VVGGKEGGADVGVQKGKEAEVNDEFRGQISGAQRENRDLLRWSLENRRGLAQERAYRKRGGRDAEKRATRCGGR